jgi:uracil phosphoribosyltransferase
MVFLLDPLIATGGTARAALNMIAGTLKFPAMNAAPHG